MPRSPDAIDPDTEDNSEQSEAGAQAQDIASDALTRRTDLSEDSVKGGGYDRGALIPDDVPDLVDKMEEMNRSGTIDNGAYAGEPLMDDEDGWLGNTEEDVD